MDKTDEEAVKRTVLSLVSKLESIKKVRAFMVEDLEKTMELDCTSRGAPNFMLALALCAYTEYWGRLVKGIPQDEARGCFDAFLERMGSSYKKLLGELGGDVYWKVRCGLAHSYLIEGDAMINFGEGKSGIEYDPESKTFTFNIQTYFEDFERAVDKYISDLLENKECLLEHFEQAFLGKPILV